MDSTQRSTPEGASQRHDESHPPPPNGVTNGETGPSPQQGNPQQGNPQQGNSERAALRSRPSRLATQDAGATTSRPTGAGAQNELPEELEYFRHGFRRLRDGPQQHPAEWDRVETSVMMIHDEMVTSRSQLARLQRQRQADTRLHMSLEQNLHRALDRLADAERRAAEAEAKVRMLQSYCDFVRAEIASALRQLQRTIASDIKSNPPNGCDPSP